MINFWTKDNIKFIPSAKIKVFPCSYRGYNSRGSLFNPEANAFTEYNFTNIYSKSKSKESFVISWEKTGTDDDAPVILKCSIGGYYFEISDINESDFLNRDGTLYKLIIKLKDVSIGDDKTKILDSIIGETADSLDTLPTDSSFVGYYFVGLGLAPEDSQDFTYSLSPCIKVKDETEDGQPITYHAEINWAEKRLEDIIAPGDGHSSLKMLGKVVDNKSGVCSATGDYSIALGEKTAASGKHAVALGVESKATKENSVAIGNKAESNHTNAFALGNEVKTGGENQTIIGYNTTADANDTFVIGNDGKKLAVDKNGNLNLTGNIIASGNETNQLVLGNITESNGSIAVYGDLKTAIENYEKLNDEAIYDPNETYYIFEHDEFIEEEIEEEDFETEKNNLYIRSDIEREKVFDLNKDGDLTVTGDVELKEELHVIKDINGDKDINGHGNLTLSSGNDTHILTLGSPAVNDAGQIDLYGPGSEKVFIVSTIGNVTATGSVNIGSGLTVSDQDEETDLKANLVVNKDNIKYSTITNDVTTNKFIVNTDGQITANNIVLANSSIDTNGNIAGNSISLGDYGIANDGNITGSSLNIGDSYGIGSDGKITGKSLDVNGLSIGNDQDKLKLAGGMSLFNDNSESEISFNKQSYTVRDINTAYKFKHEDALQILNKYRDESGLHISGNLTASGDFAIFSDDDVDGYVTTKITQEGRAYFKKELLIGGNVTGTNVVGDTVTFRVGTFGDREREINFANLKGNLYIKKYVKNNNSTAGHLTVEGNSYLKNELFVGTVSEDVYTRADNIATFYGGVTASYFNATSDLRLKTEIKDYYNKKSILDLPIKEFEFINDKSHTKHIGCIAQDLQEICPELVHKDNNGYLSIEENKLVYLLLQEVKELKKEIKSLKGE